MNLTLSSLRGRARRSTALGAALACSLGCFAARAQTDQGEKRTPPPQESPSEPGSPPVAAQPDLAPAAAPLPSAPEPSASSWTWPRVLLLGAVGVEVVGVAVVLTSVHVAESVDSAAERSWPNAITRGCQGGMTSCATVIEASQAGDTALDVGEVVFYASTGGAFLLWAASAAVDLHAVMSTNPAAPASKSASPQVAIAPAPGGFVIRGTF